ncbi:MAG: leucyl aminopeptidase [Terriglobales bacterium]
MKTNLSIANPAEVETECLVAVVLDRGTEPKTEISIETNDDAVKESANEIIGSGEISGELLETTLLHRPAKLKAKRLLLIGGGKAKTFTAFELRKLAGTAARFLKSRGMRSFAFLPPSGVKNEEAVNTIVEGAFVGNFDSDTYKSDRKDKKIDSLTVMVKGDQTSLQRAMEQARIIGESQNFTRELVNEPGNHLTPTVLAERARKMAAEVGLACEVLDGEKIRELKMGAFWGVSQGSDEPPALVVLRYEPAAAPEKPVLGLVGKAITFDSGGISIKPADGMEKMKYDMAGGAAMLGAMRGIALLKPKVRVTAIICASENMPSGKAQKPGDIQISMSGKSIEIINTDAEGRLVLADGLSYARQLGCTHLIDAATLTGAVVVALGSVNAGVFANDDKMFERFSEATNVAGEKFWRLPLDAEYREIMNSNIADIVNSGGRWGGAISAAMFLKEFAEDTPWMHLDIAGTAWMEDAKPWIAKGPSGIAVRSLIEFAREFQG